jgi:hypothetical protein
MTKRRTTKTDKRQGTKQHKDMRMRRDTDEDRATHRGKHKHDRKTKRTTQRNTLNPPTLNAQVGLTTGAVRKQAQGTTGAQAVERAISSARGGTRGKGQRTKAQEQRPKTMEMGQAGKG